MVFVEKNLMALALAMAIFLVSWRAMAAHVAPKARSLAVALRQFAQDLAGAGDAEVAETLVNRGDIELHHPALSQAWVATRNRTIAISVNAGTKKMLLAAPTDLWSSRSLLQKQLNVLLVDAVPNLLVGVGLLCTFGFLTYALYEAVGAVDGGQASGSISAVLDAASGKFITSLVGLFCSIFWTVHWKRLERELDEACDSVLSNLERIYGFDGTERALSAQADADRVYQAESLAYSEHQLEELRAQTAALKLFKTDLAVAMKGALEATLSPQLASMTEKLVGAIDELTRKISTINVEAMQKMAEEFAKRISDASAEEMKQFRDALLELSANLKAAGGGLKADTDAATEALKKMLEALKDITDKSGQDFIKIFLSGGEAVKNAAADAADKLGGSGQKAGQALEEGASRSIAVLLAGTERAANRLEEAGSNAANALSSSAQQLAAQALELGRALREAAQQMAFEAARFTESLSQLAGLARDMANAGAKGLGRTEQVVAQLEQAMTVINAAAQSWAPLFKQQEAVTAQFSKLTDSMKSLVASATEIADSVEKASPHALASIEAVGDLLRQAATETQQAMKATRESMQATANALSDTVASIKDGVGDYSDKVAELHRNLDGQLASAIGKIDGTISSLNEAVEDLSEVISEKFPRS